MLSITIWVHASCEQSSDPIDRVSYVWGNKEEGDADAHQFP